MRKINSETKETTNQTITQIKIKWEKPKVIRLGRNEQTQGGVPCPAFGSAGIN